jgi:integrase/recombinase XerC
MSFKSFTDYLLLEKNYSKLTVNAYKNDLENFKAFIEIEYDSDNLLQVNYPEIRQWIVTMVESGIKNRSINRKISSLNAYYKFLQKAQQIKINPLKQHRALKAAKKIELPFSEAELKSVLENYIEITNFESSRDHLIIDLFYATGIRRIELVNLKLSDIDFQRRQLKVLGKRNKERYIPLIDSTIHSLKVYLDYRSKLAFINDKEFLLLTKKGLKIYETLVYRIINKYLSQVSSKAKCSPHVLRHSFATHLLNRRCRLKCSKRTSWTYQFSSDTSLHP